MRRNQSSHVVNLRAPRSKVRSEIHRHHPHGDNPNRRMELRLGSASQAKSYLRQSGTALEDSLPRRLSHLTERFWPPRTSALELRPAGAAACGWLLRRRQGRSKGWPRGSTAIAGADCGLSGARGQLVHDVAGLEAGMRPRCSDGRVWNLLWARDRGAPGGLCDPLDCELRCARGVRAVGCRQWITWRSR